MAKHKQNQSYHVKRLAWNGEALTTPPGPFRFIPISIEGKVETAKKRGSADDAF